ncbi:hypothetical protein [Streptomyces sp. CBMA152]|uniref:hypothetical protein n=1 Tax=Streptomyces sp. CBMA152 TaxID=1896312 RepID=UPI001660689D|nr:hypothetical protein [Streptomyces sp. CBMA152]MBD0743524.1 hypothetical protein [Streptomyces sp. CBMA152]
MADELTHHPPTRPGGGSDRRACRQDTTTTKEMTMTDRITADILVEAFHLAKPDFDDLKDRIEEAAAAHKATVTVDDRLYLTQQPAVDLAVLPEPADRAADGIDWKARYEAEHARHVAVVRSLVADPAAVLRGAADDWTAHCPDHSDAEEAFMDCPCDWAHELRRKADEAQQEAPSCTCGGPLASTTLLSGITYEEHRRDCAVMADEAQVDVEPVEPAVTMRGGVTPADVAREVRALVRQAANWPGRCA